MDLQGFRPIRAQQTQILDGLTDAEIIRAILPEMTRIEAAGPGAFDLTLKRKMGPMDVTLSGQFTFQASADPGDWHRMTLALRGPFGASARLDLQVQAEVRSAEHCRFSHQGKLEVAGLLRPILNDWQDRLQGVLNRRIDNFARAIEARAQPAAPQG